MLTQLDRFIDVFGIEHVKLLHLPDASVSLNYPFAPIH